VTGARPRAPVIAIDGPAGAGKSTVARLLAERLGYRLVPTGAMYRAAALGLIRSRIPPRDGPELRAYLRAVDIGLVSGRVLLNGEDVTDELRTEQIAAVTSDITRIAAVRDKVTPLQRHAARRGGVVLEGRDTGTVVCPDAEIKFFLTASLDERARRRHVELLSQGREVQLDGLRAELRVRDAQDETRSLAPLRQAPDAVEIETSGLTAQDVVARMLAVVEQRRTCPQAGAPTSTGDSRLYSVLRLLALGILRVFVGLKARGSEHVPSVGAVLFVANHSSLLDPPVVGACAPRQLYFLAKEELFGIPLLGRLIRALNARPVRRGGSDPAALREARRVLEEGGALLIFPEGSRGDEGVLRPAKPGASLLAVLTGAPVVPVYVRGTGRAWPVGRWFPRPTRVTVTFGPALRFEPVGPRHERKGVYERASREMMAAIEVLRDTIAAPEGGRPQLSAVRGKSLELEDSAE